MIVQLSSFILVAACAPTPYPVDVFPEMHHQPSQRRLEPERLAPPAEAVPIGGGKPRVSFERAGGLRNPLPRDPATLARARELNRINCATCHGVDGRGRGPMTAYFAQAGAVAPVDFAAPRVAARADGELYWIVRHGLGGMPAYDSLLTDEELWALVHFVREVQGQ